VVTVNDVTNSFEDTVVTETARIRDTTRRTAKVRAAFFGFSYTFGGGKARPEQFDFGSGGPG